VIGWPDALVIIVAFALMYSPGLIRAWREK
jgi:hypothetical protein